MSSEISLVSTSSKRRRISSSDVHDANSKQVSYSKVDEETEEAQCSHGRSSTAILEETVNESVSQLISRSRTAENILGVISNLSTTFTISNNYIERSRFFVNMLLESPVMFTNPQLSFNAANDLILNYSPITLFECLSQASMDKLKLLFTMMSVHALYSGALILFESIEKQSFHELVQPNDFYYIQSRLRAFFYGVQKPYSFSSLLPFVCYPGVTSDEEILEQFTCDCLKIPNVCMIFYETTATNDQLMFSIYLNQKASEVLGYTSEEFVLFCGMRDAMNMQFAANGFIPLPALFM
jgi:hypothetical protein